MASQNPNVNNLADIVRAMYPEILTRTHSVPPMYLNQVAYRRQMVPGTVNVPALVLQPPLVAGDATPTHDLTPDNLQPMQSAPRNLWTVEALSKRPSGPQPVLQTDVNDDTAQAQVLRNLQVLGENRKETMFIISQLNFSDYLNDPAHALTVAHLPAVSVDPKTSRKRDGDFDILMIHRHFGILIGELKTVGKDPTFGTDAIVAKTIKKALKQLDKLKAEMSHLVSDVPSPGLIMRGTLFLPFVSTQQLQRVLLADPQLEQDACITLGADNGTKAAQLCCCSDHLSNPSSWWDVTPAVLQQLSTWWEARLDNPDTLMTDDIYVDVVSRCVGPATSARVKCSTDPRVCVKTEDEALAHLGHVLSTLILTEEQIDVMEQFSRSLLPLVYLTGPPGTGKTIMLTLVGLCQLRKGKDVHVISWSWLSLGASRLIKNQLESTLAAASMSASCGKVFLHDYKLLKDEEQERAILELTSLGPDVFLIFDEMISCVLEVFTSLLPLLTELVPSLKVWMAGILHSEAPPGLREIRLSTPLRTAPAILREVQDQITAKLSGSVLSYNNTRIPAAGDGKRVERLVHECSGHNGHTGDQPELCFLCGQNVAAVLHQLGVGGPGSQVSPRDVFILTSKVTNLRKDVTDDANTTTDDCDLVHGVRHDGFAVRVIMDPLKDSVRWKREVGEVAEAAWDSVVAMDYNSIHGLERKVVVLLGDDPGFMLYAASRATTQLVVVSSRSSPST